MGTTESFLVSEDTSSWDGRVIESSQRQQHESSQNGVGSQRPQKSPRPKPRPVDLLKGILLGLPSSGKRTLLQRLQGKDPFDQSKPPLEPLPVHAQVTAPYKPPPSAIDFNTRIALNVQIPHSLNEKIDFAVVMVNPRHDPKLVAPYLTNVIQSLLLQAGYVPPEQDRKEKKNKKQPQPDPLCLCILLNFRDLHNRDTRQLLPQIQESDLRATVNSLLEKYPPLLKEKIAWTCGTTSLVNCYGLSILHEFIYRSYLLQKEVLLEKQLLSVRQALEQPTETKTPQDYDEYVASLSGQALNGTTNSPRRPVHEVVIGGEVSETSSREKDGRRRNAKPQQIEKKPKSQAADSTSERKQRRGVMHEKVSGENDKSQAQLNSAEAQRSALEAFLAEEDDEDDMPLSARKQRRTQSEDSDEEEDDDFFYDEAGARHGTFDDSSTSSSDEEEPVQKSQPPVRKQKSQPRLPSISESTAHEAQDSEASSDTPSDDKDREEKAETEKEQETVTRKEEQDPRGPESSNVDEAIHAAQADDADSEPEGQENAAVGNDIERNQNHGDAKDTSHGNEQVEKDDEAPSKETEVQTPPHADTPEKKSSDNSDNEAPNSDTESADVSPVSTDNAPSSFRTPISPPDTGSNCTSPVTNDSTSVSPSSPRPDTTSPNDEKEGTAPATKDTVPAPSSQSHNNAQDNSDSDDDFVVDEISVTDETPPASKDEPTTTTSSLQTSSGMSAAALAAIAAAQREAELMLQQDDKGPSSPRPKKKKDEKKKKKKKDDGSEKKKKKKKRDKERRSKIAQDAEGET